MFDIATLIETKVQYDENGQPATDEYGVDLPPCETSFEIPVEVKSCSQNEFYKAGAAGIRLSMVLITDKGNYNGQKYIIYRGSKYKVHRTFIKNNRIELYIEERAGV